MMRFFQKMKKIHLMKFNFKNSKKLKAEKNLFESSRKDYLFCQKKIWHIIYIHFILVSKIQNFIYFWFETSRTMRFRFLKSITKTTKLKSVDWLEKQNILYIYDKL